MYIEVSIGEAVDKLSILEIKEKYIKNKEKIIEIQKEICSLKQCEKYKKLLPNYYKLLVYVNETIWKLTDHIKKLKIDNPDFAKTADHIFEYNQKRFRIKKIFNLKFDSNIKEQKGYYETHCQITSSQDAFIKKISEIYYLTLNYDIVSFKDLDKSFIENHIETPVLITEIQATQNIHLDSFFIDKSSFLSYIPHI